MLLLWLPINWAMLLVPVAVIAALVLIVRGNRRGSAWKLWVGVPFGCAFAPALLIALLLGLTTAWNAWRPASSAFAEILPEEPADLALRADTSAGLDSASILLELRYDRAWLAQAKDYYRFRLIDPDSALIDSLRFSDAPSWWQIVSDHKKCPAERRWVREDLEGWDDVALVECPKAGRLFLLGSAID